MQNRSSRWDKALTTSHDVVSQFADPATGTTFDPQMEDGQVALDVTSFVRRQLTLTAPNLESLFQRLSVPGDEVAVTSGIRYGTTTELMPAGVFRVDEADIGYSASGQLQLTLPDRSVVVQRNRMGVNRSSVATNTVWQEIQRLVEGAFTPGNPFPGWAQLDTSATDLVGAQIYDSGNRDEWVASYCTDNSLDFEFNAVGKAVLRKVPTGGIATWTAIMGPGGILMDASRTRGLSDTRNVIILTTTRTDVQLAAWEEANLNSPLIDKLSSLGKFGRQVLDYQGNFTSTDQMKAAGRTILRQRCAIQQKMTVTTVGNAALDGWDQVALVLPRSDMGNRPAETHLVQGYTLPLTNKGQMQITGRAAIAT